MSCFDLLHEKVRALALERFEKPTEIQELMISRILSSKNVLGISATGSGKTEAVLLPIFSLLLNSNAKPISVLYVSPLRALGRDLLERINWWSQRLGIPAMIRHGDTSQYERGKQMQLPAQLLVTTPETLGAILPAPKMGKHLENVKFVIVDEVHELCQDKRGAQLVLALERLVEVAGEFQRIGLSATVGDPAKVAGFLFAKREHEIVKTRAVREMEIKVECPLEKQEDLILSERLLLPPIVIARLRRLKELVEENGSVLTFVNTRQAAEMLSSRFAAWEKTQDIGVHHSSLSKDVRIVAEKKFKNGSLKGIVATSSLELGIDIGKINAVVQYGSPRQVCRLVQRIGRSGHSMERTPKGTIIASDFDDLLESAVIAKAALKGELEKPKIYEKPYDVLAHQIAGLALDFRRMKIEKAYEILRRASPFQDLSLSEFLSVLKQLAAERIIWHEKEEFGKRKASYLYYYSNLSMIPDEVKFFVKDVTMNKNVAVLDEAFVANNLEIGSVFICKGLPWKVLDVSEKEVLVEPSEDISGAIPAWAGEQIPVPSEIAEQVGAVREKIVANEALDYPLDENSVKKITRFMKKQKKFFIPDNRKIVFEKKDNFLVMHCCFGSLVNETLGKILSVLISAYIGETLRMKSDAYHIIFEFQEKPKPELIKQFLLETKPESVQPILEKSLLRTQLFRYKFIHVARRFGLIEKGADYQKISVRKLIDAVFDSPIYLETLREIEKEKLDMEKTKKVLERIQKKEIKIVEYDGKLSLFTAQALKKIFQVPELILPLRPEAEIIKILRKKINEKNAKLFCTYCHSIFYSKIKDLPEKIKCRQCGSTVITYAKANERVEELFENKKMEEKELKRRKEYELIASLINAYGKKAVIVLTGKGIGPETAVRVLGRMRKTEKQLFKDMLEEQKTFLRTKKYWTS